MTWSARGGQGDLAVDVGVRGGKGGLTVDVEGDGTCRDT